jgi:precorrin-6x reductase
MVYVSDFQDAAEVIAKKNFMRILLTTGSKSLHEFKGICNREIFARILPSADSIEKCIAAGIARKQIIAMEGPFSLELNIALINQFKIQCLVTKNSGRAGGFMEKIEACQKTGITAIVVEPA